MEPHRATIHTCPLKYAYRHCCELLGPGQLSRRQMLYNRARLAQRTGIYAPGAVFATHGTRPYPSQSAYSSVQNYAALLLPTVKNHGQSSDNIGSPRPAFLAAGDLGYSDRMHIRGS